LTSFFFLHSWGGPQKLNLDVVVQKIKKHFLLFINVMALFVIICSSVAVFAAGDGGPICDEDCNYIEYDEECRDGVHTHYWCKDGGFQSCHHQNCP